MCWELNPGLLQGQQQQLSAAPNCGALSPARYLVLSDCCCHCRCQLLLLKTGCRLACQCPSVAEETLWEVLNLSFCLSSQPALRGCVLGTPLACEFTSPAGYYENTEEWKGAKPCAGSCVAACTTCTDGVEDSGSFGWSTAKILPARGVAPPTVRQPTAVEWVRLKMKFFSIL